MLRPARTSRNSSDGRARPHRWWRARPRGQCLQTTSRVCGPGPGPAVGAVPAGAGFRWRQPPAGAESRISRRRPRQNSAPSRSGWNRPSRGRSRASVPLGLCPHGSRGGGARHGRTESARAIGVLSSRCELACSGHAPRAWACREGVTAAAPVTGSDSDDVRRLAGFSGPRRSRCGVRVAVGVGSSPLGAPGWNFCASSGRHARVAQAAWSESQRHECQDDPPASAQNCPGPHVLEGLSARLREEVCQLSSQLSVPVVVAFHHSLPCHHCARLSEALA